MIRRIKRLRREFSRMTKAEQADTLDAILGVGLGVVSVTAILIWTIF